MTAPRAHRSRRPAPDVERYLEAHPLPARPSDKRRRACLQDCIQQAELAGRRFTRGAARALATPGLAPRASTG